MEYTFHIWNKIPLLSIKILILFAKIVLRGIHSFVCTMFTPLCAVWNTTPNCTHIKWKNTISSMEKYYLRFLLYYVIFTTCDENRVKSCLEDSSELRTKVAAHVEHYSLRMDLLMNYTHMMSPDLQELAAINFYSWVTKL